MSIPTTKLWPFPRKLLSSWQISDFMLFFGVYWLAFMIAIVCNSL